MPTKTSCLDLIEPSDDGRDLLAGLDDDFFAEPLPEKERLRQLGAPAWFVYDLSDAEPGPFERFDLEEIPPFDPPAERVAARRAALVDAELVDAT